MKNEMECTCGQASCDTKEDYSKWELQEDAVRIPHDLSLYQVLEHINKLLVPEGIKIQPEQGNPDFIDVIVVDLED